MKETLKSNKLANYFLEVCNFKYSKESVNNTKIKSEFVYQKIKDDFADFINASSRKKKAKIFVENFKINKLGSFLFGNNLQTMDNQNSNKIH